MKNASRSKADNEPKTSAEQMELLGMDEDDYDDIYSSFRDERELEVKMGIDRDLPTEARSPEFSEYYRINGKPKEEEAVMRLESTPNKSIFLKVSKEREYLATAKGDGRVVLSFFDGQGFGDDYKTLSSFSDEDTNLTGFDWRVTQKNKSDPLCTGVYFNGNIVTWTTKGGDIKDHSIFEEEKFTDISYSNSGSSFAVATVTGKIYIHSAEDSDKRTELTVNEQHGNRAMGFKWFDDNHNLGYSFGWDDSLKLWDIRENTGKPYATKWVPSPVSTSTFVENGEIYLGLPERKQNLRVLELKTMKFLESHTLKVQRSQGELGSTDKSTVVTGLQRSLHSPSLFAVTTAGNISMKILERKEDGRFNELISYENLPAQIGGMFFDQFLERVYLAGELYRGIFSFRE